VNEHAKARGLEFGQSACVHSLIIAGIYFLLLFGFRRGAQYTAQRKG
jgi:hypothetical protein